MSLIEVEIMQVVSLVVVIINMLAGAALLVVLGLIRRMWKELDKLHERVSNQSQQFNQRIEELKRDYVSYREFKDNMNGMIDDLKYLRENFESKVFRDSERAKSESH